MTDEPTGAMKLQLQQAPTGRRMTLKLSANDTLQHPGISLCGMDMIRVVLRLCLNR